jgi:hypothetical protein
MPEGIQRRYVVRLRSAEAAQERRWRAIVAASAAAILLGGSLMFYVIRNWARSSDAAQAASAISDMIAAGEIEQASGFLEKLQKSDSGLLSYSPMIEARQRFQDLQDRETARVLQVDSMIRATEHAPLHQINPAELIAARKLARQQSEKQAIEQLVKRRSAALAVERATREKDVGPRLDAVSRKIAGVQQKVESARFDNGDHSELLTPLAEARRELAELEADLPYVGDSLQSLATVFAQKIDATRARLDLRRRQSRLEEDLTDAVADSVTTGQGRLVRFASGLDAYIKSFPDDARSQAFKQTRDEQASGTTSKHGTVWRRVGRGGTTG